MEELEKAQLRIKELIGEVAQKEEEIKACNDIIADRDKMILAQEEDIKTLHEQNEDMQKQNNVLQNGNSSLQDKIKDYNDIIADRDKQIDKMRGKLKRLDDQNSELAEKLTAQHEAMQKEIDRYKASLEEAQAALDVEVGEREAVTRERDELQDRVSAMIASSNQKVDEFNELGESNQNLQEKIKEAEENYNSLRREFFLLSGAVDGLLMVRNAQRMGDA